MDCVGKRELRGAPVEAQREREIETGLEREYQRRREEENNTRTQRKRNEEQTHGDKRTQGEGERIGEFKQAATDPNCAIGHSTDDDSRRIFSIPRSLPR